MNPLPVAVVGTGFGARVHVPALRAAGFEVRALVGRDAERTARRAQRAGVAHAVTSLEAALDLDVVAVTVAAPPAEHEALVVRAAGAGRHVLCEKPLALDAREARCMRDAVAAADVVAMVGHEFRFADSHMTVARSISEGRIGDPVMVTIITHVGLLVDATVRMPDWWVDGARGGGWLAASGSHTVDTLRYWLGEVDSVSGDLVPLTGTTVDAGYSARLRFAGGAVAVVQESAVSHGEPFSVARVVGTRGTVAIVGGQVVIAGPQASAGDAVPAPSPPAQPVSSEPAHRFTHLELGPYTRLAGAFLAAIEGRPPRPGEPRPATLDDGVACMATIDAIRESASRGGATVPVLPG